MRKVASILFVCFTGIIQAQSYNSQWTLGYDESVLDFRTVDTVKTYTIPTVEYFTYTNANISNAGGNLLFYTNGISICGITDTLLNGSGLSPCPYTQAEATDGLDIQQGALFIPKPGNSRYYYLFHFSNDSSNGSHPGTIYYSVVDTEGNGGLGSVIEKNTPILTGVVLREGGMTACKHGNGRDYWLIMGASQLNTYYKFLVTPDSIFGPFAQNIGPAVSDTGDVTYSKFSQDGSKYATGFFAGPIILMDFDRCGGEFSNVQTIYNNGSTDPINYPQEGCASLEFSPSGRFLYASDVINLNQYDLWSGNIQDSVEIFKADSSEYYGLKMLQLSCNGKLYGSTWNGGLKALHLINFPDLKGDSCSFIYGGQPTLTINSIGLPNLINYNLGSLANSGCDTIPAAINSLPAKTDLLRIMPNPADKYVYVEMSSQGNYEFDLLNTVGQVVNRKATRQLDFFDTEALANGVYFIQAINQKDLNNTITQKLIIAH